MAKSTKHNTSILKAVQKAQLRDDLPEIHTGDTISVYLKIVEGAKTRAQRFDGVVLRVRGTGLGKTFTIRKESYGIGVEETFPYNSPLIVKIVVHIFHICVNVLENLHVLKLRLLKKKSNI